MGRRGMGWGGCRLEDVGSQVISACYGLPREQADLSVSLLCCLTNGRGQTGFFFCVCCYSFNHLRETQKAPFRSPVFAEELKDQFTENTFFSFYCQMGSSHANRFWCTCQCTEIFLLVKTNKNTWLFLFIYIFSCHLCELTL